MRFSIYMTLILAFTACNTQPSKPRLPYFLGPQMEPKWIIPGDDISAFNRIRKYSLQDQEQSLTRNDTAHLKVVHFFQWPCNASCSELSRIMNELQKRYKSDEQVQLISFAYPGNDTNANNLSDYKRKYQPAIEKWKILSGNETSMQGLLHEMPELSIGGKSSVPDFHNLYLADRAGYIRGIYDPSTPADLENLYLDIEIQKKTPHKFSP